jgi:hypothetical protein
MTRHPLPILLLGSSLFLSACMGGVPMAPAARPAPASVGVPPAASLPAPVGNNMAEQACVTAGQERGLQVLGVSGSRPNNDDIDVMLRVARSGSQLEVRCNYQTASGMARIMLI